MARKTTTTSPPAASSTPGTPKWGKRRQYVGRIMNEDARVNFTLETMCEMLSLVGKRLTIQAVETKTT